MRSRYLGLFLAVAVVLVLQTAASAGTVAGVFNPTSVLTEDPGTGDDNDIAIGFRQIQMTVEDAGLYTYSSGPLTGQTVHMADFIFRNINPGSPFGFQRSSITDIWFDQITPGGVLGPLSLPGTSLSDPTNNPIITSSSGVAFGLWAKPEKPPGWSTITPKFDSPYFSTDSGNKNFHNGINDPNEWLTIRFKLAGNSTAYDAVKAISRGELRVAIKMQGYASGGSETFLIAPAPSAAIGGVALFGVLGLSGIVRERRRRRMA